VFELGRKCFVVRVVPQTFFVLFEQVTEWYLTPLLEWYKCGWGFWSKKTAEETTACGWNSSGTTTKETTACGWNSSGTTTKETTACGWNSSGTALKRVNSWRL
jgi:hypothetical protein